MGERKITYRNPVWNGYMADPFVLKHHGEYWAYGTNGQQENGCWFPVLHSTDLFYSEYIGGVLEPLTNPDARAYWAPEVAYQAGAFYMYYSAATGAGDESHQLRVAIAEHPAGPFRDAGKILLPSEGFSIDARPFQDPKDGHRRWDACHTIDGPFVLFHKNLYYCLYSGGFWNTPDYGVGFGVAEEPLGPYRDR